MSGGGYVIEQVDLDAFIKQLKAMGKMKLIPKGCEEMSKEKDIGKTNYKHKFAIRKEMKIEEKFPLQERLSFCRHLRLLKLRKHGIL